MRRATTLLTVGALALALAACGAPGPGVQPPANTVDVTANLDPMDALDTVSLSDGESQVYRVSVPSAVVNAGLLYVEADRPVELEVMTGGYGTVTFSSSSADYFGSGVMGLAGSGLGAASVDTPVTCRGSCVLMEVANAGTMYVRVTGVGSANVSLYVYGEAHADEYEDANDLIATSPVLEGFGDSGAIETVGDVDYWTVTSTGTFTFDVVANGIELEAQIVDSAGTPIANAGGPFAPGDTMQVLAGEYVRVWAKNAWQAASSGNSTYYLEQIDAL